jgi:viroplasmin and RNaseH domain-containing protein
MGSGGGTGGGCGTGGGAGRKYYWGVANGFKTGVFTTYSEAEVSVSNWPGGSQARFNTRAEAEAYVAAGAAAAAERFGPEAACKTETPTKSKRDDEDYTSGSVEKKAAH